MAQERLECASRDSLMALLDGALALRKSEQTERNPISSRSHAICVLHFGPSGETGLPARLTLVDLAGRHGRHPLRQRRLSTRRGRVGRSRAALLSTPSRCLSGFAAKERVRCWWAEASGARQTAVGVQE